MAFTDNTFNHFMKQAKYEYGKRRSHMVCDKTRKASPTWSDLTHAQRMEWAQYMHDEWLNRKPFTNQWGLDRGAGLFEMDIGFQCVGRGVRHTGGFLRDAGTEPKLPDLGDMVATRWVSLEKHDALESKVHDLANTLEQRVTSLERLVLRHDQLHAESIKAVAALNREQQPIAEHEYKMAVCIREQAEEIDKLKATVDNLRCAEIDLLGQIKQVSRLLAAEREKCEQRKTTEDTLRKVIEQLSQDLHGERSKPKPYAVSREDLEKVNRNQRVYKWYTSHLFVKYDFTTMPVVYMTNEQRQRVQGLAHFTEL